MTIITVLCCKKKPLLALGPGSPTDLPARADAWQLRIHPAPAPPHIGFIGTTFGLAVLLLSMRVSNEGLQMGALALSSTIFALVGYANPRESKKQPLRAARPFDRRRSRRGE